MRTTSEIINQSPTTISPNWHASHLMNNIKANRNTTTSDRMRNTPYILWQSEIICNGVQVLCQQCKMPPVPIFPSTQNGNPHLLVSRSDSIMPRRRAEGGLNHNTDSIRLPSDDGNVKKTEFLILNSFTGALSLESSSHMSYVLVSSRSNYRVRIPSTRKLRWSGGL